MEVKEPPWVRWRARARAVAGGTRGENVNLPAETALSFKLQAPLTIQPE